MSQEPVPISSQTPAIAAENVRAIERGILAVTAIVLLHVILLAMGAIASTLVALRPVTFVPKEPLLLTIVALVMAHSSLSAIWWARTSWSPHAKAVSLVILAGGLWLLLLATLDNVRAIPTLAASWAVSLIFQMVLTGLGVVILELFVHYERAAQRSRFSLFFLMLWTTIIAVMLSAAGVLAARHGFRLSDVTRSDYFLQLQFVGMANAALAIVAYSGARLSRTLRMRIMTSTTTILASATAIPLALHVVFAGHVGADPTDLVWVFSWEAVLLVATLIPLVTSQSETSGKSLATAADTPADTQHGSSPGL
jgi:hypothetical protein